MNRIFDIISALAASIVVFPFCLLVAVLIKLDSKGPVLYKQLRVGKDNKDFYIYKFRTMYVNSDPVVLTKQQNDNRITKIGRFLRRVKFDEVPQIINLFKGDISVVGPRPDIRRHVNYYTKEQMKVLSVKPGVTSPASLAYINEAEILEKSDNIEEYYINHIMQEKLKINLKYIDEKNFLYDMKIILLTAWNVIKCVFKK